MDLRVSNLFGDDPPLVCGIDSSLGGGEDAGSELRPARRPRDRGSDDEHQAIIAVGFRLPPSSESPEWVVS